MHLKFVSKLATLFFQKSYQGDLHYVRGFRHHLRDSVTVFGIKSLLSRIVPLFLQSSSAFTLGNHFPDHLAIVVPRALE